MHTQERARQGLYANTGKNRGIQGNAYYAQLFQMGKKCNFKAKINLMKEHYPPHNFKDTNASN